MSDITLHRVDTGSGAPALLFVHGFCSGHEDWDTQVAHFSGSHRCIAVDLRGHGRSDRGVRDMTIEQLTEDCLVVLRDTGVTEVIVVDHSMGTRIALEMAQRAPEVVRGMVLVDGSNAGRAGTEAALDAFDKVVLERTFAGFAQHLFEDMFFDEKHAALSQRLVQRALAVPGERAHALYRNMIRWDGDKAADALTRSRVPILVIQSTTRAPDGARRPLAPGETGAYETLVKQYRPDAEVVTMPGLGHFATYEAPDAVNAAIQGWLARI